jgi:hypothetical protein
VKREEPSYYVGNRRGAGIWRDKVEQSEVVVGFMWLGEGARGFFINVLGAQSKPAKYAVDQISLIFIYLIIFGNLY